MNGFIARLGNTMTSKLMRGSAAGLVLLAFSTLFASAYAEPVGTGPLSITGSLDVRGPLTVDGSLTVAGDVDAHGPITAASIERIYAGDPAASRHWGENTFYGPLTVHGPLIVHGDLVVHGPINVGGAAVAVGRVNAEGPITERR
ncbi:hypothetical protein D1Y85_09475 [Paraburkholderia dinghuensis]|uniref:Polymer-forming cytoskeletal protein n=1 Tax=Paraburkholderia dinghuensis TaxID=2305225 RepID=A0A3N6P0P2_9BURK|nr:hypothetical protein D1Y85_09475 [Paraburkholderia dinghuensis]